MAIDFPSSPTPGQIYQGYYWDSNKNAWKSLQSQTGAVITSSTTPTGAKNGDLWFNTIDGTLFVYFNDGISFYWTEIKANSSLNTTLGNRVTAVESGKANLAGGNTFTGTQTFSNLVLKPGQPMFHGNKYGNGTTITENPWIATNIQANVGNYYNTSNGRFTAQVAGYYFVGSAFLGNTGSGIGGVQKNGSDVAFGHWNHTTVWEQASSMGIVYLAVGDYLTWYVNGSGAYNGGQYNSQTAYLIG